MTLGEKFTLQTSPVPLLFPLLDSNIHSKFACSLTFSHTLTKYYSVRYKLELAVSNNKYVSGAREF